MTSPRKRNPPSEGHEIRVIGARSHNLQNISVAIPRDRLVVVTGVSGSGKSSLVFDTLYAAAQREYLQSLSSYARRALPQLTAPNVTRIDGLSAAIVIDQRPLGSSPRSTVGTVTEAYTYLRLLFSRVGDPGLSASSFSFNTPEGACDACTGLGVAVVPDLDRLLDRSRSLDQGAILHRTWKVGSRYWNILQATGWFPMDRPLRALTKKELDTLLYAEPIVRENSEPGYVQRFSFEGVVQRLRKRLRDERGQAANDYDRQFFVEGPCDVCRGSRLNARARAVRVAGRGIDELVGLEVRDLLPWLNELKGSVADAIAPFLRTVLGYIVDTGLPYLTLNRSIATLSGGESQRVKLARQLGSQLTHLLYLIDEPTQGLHPQSVKKLVELLRHLSRRPNAVVVVEHDREFIEGADYLVELGPGGGERGGHIVAHGTPEQVRRAPTATGRYLSGRMECVERAPLVPSSGFLRIRHARLHNLQDVNVDIPLSRLVAITGVSGSGKSSLLSVLQQQHPTLRLLDQSPVGSSSRANLVTYVDAFEEMRREFASYCGTEPSLFTFNGEGACEACSGLGVIQIDMHFLGDVTSPCERCGGRRYNERALRCLYKGRTIADVLEMTALEAAVFFSASEVRQKLVTLSDVGLDYLRLGQALNTLSGGERQRLKIAECLTRGGQIYALDEPTRGLHPFDVERLLSVLDRLVARGNSLLVVEHNLDVVRRADWIVEVGPGAGRDGGRIVAEGTPRQIAKEGRTETGRFLAAQFSEEALRG